MQKWKENCLTKATPADQLQTRVATLGFQGPAACLETMLSHPPALSHDLLAEVIQKNKPKPANVKSNGIELMQSFPIGRER